MSSLVGPLYLLSTAIFVLATTVVGLRLVALSRATGGRPERLIGMGLQLTGGWGYGIMIFSIIARQQTGDLESPLGVGLTALGWVLHNVGVLFMLAFITGVFRPGEGWARVVAVAMAVVMWGGWLAYAVEGGLVTAIPTRGYWIAFAAIGTYPLWAAFEAFRYWGKMRRRAAIGLAEPILVDRFRMWGIASLCAAASIWIVNVPAWLGVVAGSGRSEVIVSLCMIATAGFGIATVAHYWLTFFPPAWYRARFAEA